MNAFLDEVGKKFAERWMSLLALPGLLYLATAAVAVTLGHRNAWNLGMLSGQITEWSTSRSLRSVGGAALIVVAVLLGSIAAGLLAGALGHLVEMMWTMPGRRRPARWLAARRRTRSRAAKSRADAAATQAELSEAIAEANRICLLEADRPTWIGDRLRVTRLRVAAFYGLDIDSTWALLWLILSEDARNELSAARDAFATAARITAWGLLYLVLVAWWWPALFIAAGTLMTAHLRSRSATANLAALIEAVVDLHAQDLANRVQQTGHTYTDPEVGQQITRLVQKSRWDPGSALAD
ncbi:hypothetical protein ACFWPQ_47760 [Streptomyces sp. NPDC058464]|uniref:hypothetical protein n=1 Tax=Streptomyces sp. NPDC058464 TaxID=3346511 RepID=UPI0036550A2C